MNKMDRHIQALRAYLDKCTIQEKSEVIVKLFMRIDEGDETIDLSGLELDRYVVDLGSIKGGVIYNIYQKAHTINNDFQQARKDIDNSSQTAGGSISNMHQEAKGVHNENQCANWINNRRQTVNR